LPRTGRAQYYPSPWPHYHGLFHYVRPQPQPVQTAVFILCLDAFCQCGRQRHKLYIFDEGEVNDLDPPRSRLSARRPRCYWRKQVLIFGSVMTKRHTTN
jgi:hypothetical protein